MNEIYKIKVYTDGDLEFQQEYNNLGQAIEDYAKYRTRGMAKQERLVALISPTGDVVVKKSLRNLHSI